MIEIVIRIDGVDVAVARQAAAQAAETIDAGPAPARADAAGVPAISAGPAPGQEPQAGAQP